jgi:hypothetical protein
VSGRRPDRGRLLVYRFALPQAVHLPRSLQAPRMIMSPDSVSGESSFERTPSVV